TRAGAAVGTQGLLDWVPEMPTVPGRTQPAMSEEASPRSQSTQCPFEIGVMAVFEIRVGGG
ncbi:MAG: hypothetical protein ACRDQ9_16940, partial [Pseudonocardiaceae bacterium]